MSPDSGCGLLQPLGPGQRGPVRPTARRKGKRSGWASGCSGPRGQAKWSVGLFLLHFFSGINKAVFILGVPDVLRCGTCKACGSSVSSNRNCPACSSSPAGTSGSLVCTVRPNLQLTSMPTDEIKWDS